MNLSRVKAITRKEFIHIIRDWRSLVMAIVIPVMMLLMFGFALTLDVNNVPLAVWNQDKSQESLDLLLKFQSSRYFKIIGYFNGYSQLENLIYRNKAMMAIVIPPQYSSDIRAGRIAQVQMLVDGTDANTATIALGYLDGIINKQNSEFILTAIHKAGGNGIQLLDLRPRVWFNEILESRIFIIPGLIAVILAIIAALLTSMTVAKEWERGTMEQLISTPVTAGEIILGKFLPYFAVGFFDFLIAVLMAQFVFGVPMRGSFVLLFFLSALFITGAMSFGILISIITKNQLLSSQIAILGTFLPAFLLSGYVYPIVNMPWLIQLITYFVPARYFITVARGIYLKGAGLNALWPQALLLFVFAFGMLLMARKKFEKKVF